METLIIKRKEFEIIEQINENCYKVSRKGKDYFVKKFEPKSDEYNDYVYAANRIKSALVLAPRIRLTDKKNGYVVSDYITGQTVLEYLCENDPTDDDPIYKNIFITTHLARVNGIVLNCKPNNWIITKNGLVYMKHVFDVYSKDKDFTQTDIKLWFLTRELARFANDRGYVFNVNRLKDEYLTNKRMVLITCKYYQ